MDFKAILKPRLLTMLFFGVMLLFLLIMNDAFFYPILPWHYQMVKYGWYSGLTTLATIVYFPVLFLDMIFRPQVDDVNTIAFFTPVLALIYAYVISSLLSYYLIPLIEKVGKSKIPKTHS